MKRGLSGAILASCLFAAALAAFQCGCASPRAVPHLPERKVLLMGTWLELRALGEERGPEFDAAFDQISGEIRHAELEWSTWRSDSELSQINQKRLPWGRSVLAADLARILELSALLDGAFHPGLGRWILDSGVREGTLNHKRLSDRNRRHRIPKSPDAPQWAWEEGGFGKGLALDRARDRIVKRFDREGANSFDWMINLGGQVLHHGSQPVAVSVAAPQERTRGALQLSIHNESIATSGQAENPGHLLDPRTGTFVPDRGSATVIHSSALVADLVATALAVMGPERTARWWRQARVLGEFRRLEWLWIEHSGAMTASCGISKRLPAHSPTPPVQILTVGCQKPY